MITLKTEAPNEAPVIKELDAIVALYRISYEEVPVGTNSVRCFHDCGRIKITVESINPPVIPMPLDRPRYSFSTFCGPRDEMLALVRLAYIYISRRAHEPCERAVMAATKTIMGYMNENAYVHTLLRFHPNVRRLAFLAAAGITEKQDVDLAMSSHNDDLVAALQLVREGTCSFRAALSL